MTLSFTILGCGSSMGVPRPALGWGDCDPNKGGTVQVTAYGSTNHFCNVTNPPRNKITSPMMGENTDIFVQCRNGTTGGVVDSMFTMTYGTLSINAAQSGGYVYADNPSASQYFPNVKFSQQFVNTGDGNDCPHCFYDLVRVTRIGAGTYDVLFPDLRFNNNGSTNLTNVHVTTVSAGRSRCKVNDWSGTNSTTTVQVGCYLDAVKADARFIVNVMSLQYIMSN
jgi:hypothetical protein